MRIEGNLYRWLWIGGAAVFLSVSAVTAQEEGRRRPLVDGSAESMNAGPDLDSAAAQLEATEADLLRQMGEIADVETVAVDTQAFEEQPYDAQALADPSGVEAVPVDSMAAPLDASAGVAAAPPAQRRAANPPARSLPGPEDTGGITISEKDVRPKRDLVQQVRAMEQVSQPSSVPAPSSPDSARIADLERKLGRAQARINGLVSELDKARNRLMLSETEVERLSAVIDERYRARYSSYAPAKKRFDEDYVSLNGLPPSLEGKVTEDMPIATVMVEKANLRTGPGVNNSPLMSVSKGTRLAVETRKGDWYRIISPTGTRAWISAQVVGFNVGRGPDPASTVRVKGFDPRLDKIQLPKPY